MLMESLNPNFVYDICIDFIHLIRFYNYVYNYNYNDNYSTTKQMEVELYRMLMEGYGSYKTLTIYNVESILTRATD